MDENEDGVSESNANPNEGSTEKPMHLCLGAFSDRQIPPIRGPFSAASTKRKIKKMRDLAEELSIYAKVQIILCYVAPNKKIPTRFLESYGEHADGYLYSTNLGTQVYSTLDNATKTWIGPYCGKKSEKKHVKNKKMNSVIDENDQNTTEIARNAVNIAVKKAATMKRLRLLEEQRKNEKEKKDQNLASVKPKKPVNKKSNPVQGQVHCSPPRNLIYNPKSSECLPSTPNDSSSQSFTPQKTSFSNISVSLVNDRINEDPIHEQDSSFETPITKITTSEETFPSSRETDDENSANENPLSLLEEPVNIFGFSQDEALALDPLSQPKTVSPVRPTNSLVPSLKANKHPNITRDISTQFIFPAKRMTNMSKSRLPVPLRVEKTKDSPRKKRRTKQKPTCQSENTEVIKGGSSLEKSRSKNKPFSAVAAAKKRKYPENGGNNNQSITTGCAILSHCTSEKETETVQSAPLKKNQLPKDAPEKKKSKDISCAVLSHFTPEKVMKTSEIMPSKKKQLPIVTIGREIRKDTGRAILSHCTPEKVIKTSLNVPFKEQQLSKDDSCSPSSTVSTPTESVRQKKWVLVLSSDDSPVKVKQTKPKKKLFLCGK